MTLRRKPAPQRHHPGPAANRQRQSSVQQPVAVPRAFGMLLSVIRIVMRGPSLPIDGTLERAERLLMVPLYWPRGDKCQLS